MPGLICSREKLWTRTYSIGDQVPTCPVFTHAKIKSRFGILVNFASHYIIYSTNILTLLAELRIYWLLLLLQMDNTPFVSDSEVSVLKSLGVFSTPSLSLLPGPLWPRVLVPVRVSSMGRINLFKNCVWLDCGKKTLKNQLHKK